MSRVSSRLLPIGGVLLGVLIAIAPPPSAEDQVFIVATASGFVDADAALRRESEAVDNLAAQAESFPDSFAAVAAVLFNVASERAYTVGALHAIASELNPDSPGISHAVRTAVADARMLMEAHLLFKRMAENETRARLALGLVAAAGGDA